MFIQLANALVQSDPGLSPHDIGSFHPFQLQAAMDALYEFARVRNPAVAPIMPNAGIGDRTRDGNLAPLSLRDELLRVLVGPYETKRLGGEVLATALARMLSTLSTPIAPRLWPHLIYPYMLEATRIFEIFDQVLVAVLHGERLGSLSDDGHRWCRTTEELFFRDSGSHFISSIQSSIRPDMRATRRNAYYRMFGMDLPHGTRDNRPYPYVKAEASNRDFVPVLENFLREVWRGYINSRNTSGPNETDDAQIADLALRLQEALGERRISGTMSREEYVIVCTMTWFHQAVASPDSPIVRDLKATAMTPEERLRKLGERVGVAMHPKSRSLFRIAEPLSRILIQIEAGTFSTSVNVPRLYNPALPDAVTADTIEIVNHWFYATGRDPKAMPVSTTR